MAANIGAPLSRQGSTKGTFTNEGLRKNRNRVRGIKPDGTQIPGVNQKATYWKVASPGQALQLRTSPKYVQDNFSGAQGTQRFVYFPEWSVAGTAEQIAAALIQGGENQIRNQSGQAIAITAQNVLENSIDPLRPEHQTYIIQLLGERAPAQRRQPTYTLQQYMEILNAVRQGQGRAVILTPAERASGVGVGGKSPQAKLATLVANFNQFMDNVLNNIETKVYNVSEFNASKYTNARSASATKADIRPVIQYQNKTVAVPIVVKSGSLQQGSATNFENFVNLVVRHPDSKYASLAPQILQDFQNRIQRPIGSTLPMGPPIPGTGAPFGAMGQVPGQSVLSQMAQPTFPPLPSAGTAPQLPPGLPTGGFGTGFGTQLPPLQGGGGGVPQFQVGGASPRGTQLPPLQTGGTSPRGTQLPPLQGAGGSTLGAGSPGLGGGSTPGSGSGSPRGGRSGPTGLPMAGGTALPPLPTLTGAGGQFAMPQLPTASPGLPQ